MAMTDEQIERYSRHIILKEVGAKGQKKLMKGKVLIIGAGGLGAPAAMYLAAAGVGTIGIVDADEVDLSNLQRQIIHSTADIGKAKVKSAKETMNAMNPDVEVKTYRMFVDASNIRELIRDYDFIIDGTDNFPAKFLINDACVLEKKPFSHAGNNFVSNLYRFSCCVNFNILTHCHDLTCTFMSKCYRDQVKRISLKFVCICTAYAASFNFNQDIIISDWRDWIFFDVKMLFLS